MAVNYLLDNCYFTLVSVYFHKLIEIPMAGLWGMTETFLWQTYFCIITKGSGFFKRFEHFQMFLCF